MYASFNDEQLPIINVTFNNETLNDDSYQEFLQNWNNCGQLILYIAIASLSNR